ncbi:MAG: MFS transporter [Proteobacteria bacterium]|nr:MFS transporter [Pseudomonadota bacterium]
MNTEPVDTFFGSIGIPLKFDAEHVTVINAGTIILFQVVVSRIVKNIWPLPTMVSGIALGSLGFVCLAFASNVWIFIIGIAVFSIGEMTAHPKYYSYVGLVAPADKKAVYMGYAFLYGVVGSLVGSNLGGALYESLLKPLVGQSGIEEQLRNFWLLFAGLGVMAMGGLIAYNKIFAENTPRTNLLAWRVMLAVYGLLVVLGMWYFTSSVSGEEISYKTMVQAVIMLLIGSGGVTISLRHKSASSSDPPGS